MFVIGGFKCSISTNSILITNQNKAMNASQQSHTNESNECYDFYLYSVWITITKIIHTEIVVRIPEFLSAHKR